MDSVLAIPCQYWTPLASSKAGMGLLAPPATETMKISGHTQFVTFARYVNVNEQATRKGAERLAEYIRQSGANESQELVH